MRFCGFETITTVESFRQFLVSSLEQRVRDDVFDQTANKHLTITSYRCEHRDRHVAVTVKDLEPLISSLETHRHHFTFSKSGRRAVFTRDLDANAIEFVEDPTTQ